jgi:hypothetical protein
MSKQDGTENRQKMDIFPKFIIETDDELGDCLIISKCTYHKELVTDHTKVKGGGWFRFKDGTFTFYGDSHDLGAATFEDIKHCVETGNVFTNTRCHLSIATKYKFFYDTQSEVIPIDKTKINTI